MAIAIMGGLTVATLLTIFFVPALYAAWFRVGRTAARGSASAQLPGAPARGARGGGDVSVLLVVDVGAYLVEPALVPRVVSISRY